MGYVKCPRCELNYCLDSERYCPVCKREMRGEEEREELELCAECGERPSVLGEELCSVCIKELSRQEGVAADMEAEDTVIPEDPDLVSLEATSEMEEMEIDLDEEIPSTEFSEIDRELGLSQEDEDSEEIDETLDDI